MRFGAVREAPTPSPPTSLPLCTYVIVGSGEPPILLHVSSIFTSSVAMATLPGEMTGGWGGVRTVKL